MGLLVTSLSLADFRSFERLSLAPAPTTTILVGPNAAGKTNTVEALQLLTAGASFRRPRPRELVREGADSARIDARLEGDGRVLDARCDVVAGRRSFSLNGKRCQASDMPSALMSVLFSPDDLALVKRGASVRRDELDLLGRQVSRGYAHVLAEYQRAVEQRNRLLHEERPDASLLEALDRIQLPRSFDLCTLDASSTAGAVLTSFGLPLGSQVVGQQALTLDITRQIPQLYTYAGTHTFALTLGDAAGKTTQATLTLVVKRGGTQTGPVITWRGYNIDQSYDLSADMTIVVDIESENGIKAFEVNIDSEVLAPMLGAVGIPETFDLCTVDGALAETLQSFGFKTGSDVTSPMSFDITQFVSILMMMDAGEHKFHLAVTDDNGVTTRKTLHLINRK